MTAFTHKTPRVLALLMGVFLLALPAAFAGEPPPGPNVRPRNPEPDFRVTDVRFSPQHPQLHLKAFFFPPGRAVYKGKFFSMPTGATCASITPLSGADQSWLVLDTWIIEIGDLSNVSRAEVVLTSGNGQKKMELKPGKTPGTMTAVYRKVSLMNSQEAQSNCKDPMNGFKIRPILWFTVTAYGPGNKTKVKDGDASRDAILAMRCCYF